MKSRYRPACPDCNTAAGELHRHGCDVEQCPYCGRQLLFHLCCNEAADCQKIPDKDRLPWTGYWPGELDCTRLNWAAKRAAVGWEPCDPNDPEARPDLNRLKAKAKWDRVTKQFIAP